MKPNITEISVAVREYLTVEQAAGTIVKRAAGKTKGKLEAAKEASEALQHANWALLGKAHRLLNSRHFRFTRRDKASGIYLITQRWIDGQQYPVHFGRNRAVAVGVNLDTLLAHAYLYSNAHYPYESKGLPVPLHPPLELSLTGGHVAIANRLGRLLVEMHDIHGAQKR